MRKRIIPNRSEAQAPSEGDWLDLEQLAEAEITSEDPAYPIEDALVRSGSSGWRAADAGEQAIRLVFPNPRRIEKVWLHFVEPDRERTQQFVLRWSPDDGKTMHEVVRQQWNFHPQGAREEVEDIHLGVPGVTLLELLIIPDISGGGARASLAELRVK